ncbi:MAG TPA: glycosyltransferase [Candidatus Dormibacteraeota bacterium]|nr:glycosyltransferase [Candidatus Dormibacteraeota bacterium]
MATTRANLQTVELNPTPLERYRSVLGEEPWTAFSNSMRSFANRVRGRVVWNVNSTARGGGVAEMLDALIPYDMAAGVDERWLVIEGSPDFFEVTKKMHTLLHGVAPDGAELTAADRDMYERTLEPNVAALLEVMRPGDLAVLHDPQTVGLIPALTRLGVKVVWRSHIGVDEPNDIVRGAWRFLAPYLSTASAVVFSRGAYVWDGCEPSRVRIIAPCIDPFTNKNRELDTREINDVLSRSHLIDRVPASARFVMQVSRWDRLKDPVGVVEAFGRHIGPGTDAWLVLAGPQVKSVDDDPEQPEVIAEVQNAVGRVDNAIRDRIVIAQISMEDLDENALIVNALQRRAHVVVQKSLAEGFGLTVAEAMWKSRPLVASRVGGIEDQIESQKSGILVDDPKDLRGFGDAVVDLLEDRPRAEELGRAARLRVVSEFLAPRHLLQQAELLSSLV